MSDLKLDFRLPTTLPTVLPVLPLRKGVLLPGGVNLFTVGRPKSRAAIEASVDKLIIVAAQREPVDDPTGGDLLEIGGVLAAAISESGDRPWRATASRFALGYSGATATGTRCLQGAVDGLKVLVIESPPGAGRSAQSRVQVSLPVRAAASLRVLQRLDVLGAAGANPTDAQIGDSLAVDCKDGEFVNQLFAEPEVVKRLTALYRRWPGTRIEGGRVQVLRDGTFGLEMIETLTLLLEFGRFFRDAMVEADLARRAQGA